MDHELWEQHLELVRSRLQGLILLVVVVVVGNKLDALGGIHGCHVGVGGGLLLHLGLLLAWSELVFAGLRQSVGFLAQNRSFRWEVELSS